MNQHPYSIEYSTLKDGTLVVRDVKDRRNSLLASGTGCFKLSCLGDVEGFDLTTSVDFPDDVLLCPFSVLVGKSIREVLEVDSWSKPLVMEHQTQVAGTLTSLLVEPRLRPLAGSAYLDASARIYDPYDVTKQREVPLHPGDGGFSFSGGARIEISEVCKVSVRGSKKVGKISTTDFVAVLKWRHA